MEEGDRLYSLTSRTSTKCVTCWRRNERTARLHEKHCVICSKKDDGPVRRSHIVPHNCDIGFHGQQQCHIKGTVCAYVVYNVQNILSVTLCLMFLISHSYEALFCIMLKTASRLKDIYIYKNTSKYVHVFMV